MRIYLSILSLFLTFWTQSNKQSNEIPLDKLSIPKHWTELTKQNNDWVYYIPCSDIRGLQTIDIIKKDNSQALSWNTGLEEQWYKIKKIIKQGDNLIFETVFPFDTTTTANFTVTFLDKERNIVRWTGEGVSCIYIPTQDTVKYKRIVQSCEDTCYKCDIEKVKIVNESLDKLTMQMVSRFLCTFDSTCTNNSEYSEWSNETLFKVLEKVPGIFFQVVAKGQVDSKILLNQIENPINKIDFQIIYDKIKEAKVPTDIKTEYLNALISAANYHGQKIKK
ncbi:MAG: hypothetical protein JNK09_11515 [Prolixibacteraceae bacterium]|nr:hypothetical protein [Prolixibacteraceae bacterium]